MMMTGIVQISCQLQENLVRSKIDASNQFCHCRVEQQR
jgi:hypothetical protein